MTHWAERHIVFIRGVVPELDAVPIYLLKADESGIESKTYWLACFSAFGRFEGANST